MVFFTAATVAGCFLASRWRGDRVSWLVLMRRTPRQIVRLFAWTAMTVVVARAAQLTGIDGVSQPVAYLCRIWASLLGPSFFFVGFGARLGDPALRVAAVVTLLFSLLVLATGSREYTLLPVVLLMSEDSSPGARRVRQPLRSQQVRRSSCLPRCSSARRSA